MHCYRNHESIEVRVSQFVYFDNNPGRRSINGGVSRDQAIEAAKALARAEREARRKVNP